jgi:predicted dehydrogenase
MQRKIKLGIIGTGLAAKILHLPALQRLNSNFEITAVCNHTEKKAKEFSELVGGVKYYLDYKDLLKDKNVEAVDITLPINLNYRVTIESLKAHKHIFLEKPLAGSMVEAKKMLGLKTEYEQVMLLAENFRYRKVYNSVKDLLKKKSIGKVYAAQWNVFYQVTSDRDYGATKWRQKHKYVGGFMLDAGVHNIAALRMLFGEVKSVTAFTESINPKIGKPDTMSVQMIFSSGIKVIYNLFFTVKHHWENKLLVFGDRGTIEANDDMISLKLNDNTSQIIDGSDFGGYDDEFMDFYNAIVNRKKVKSTFIDGYKDMEVVFAALKSAEKNKVIQIK